MSQQPLPRAVRDARHRIRRLIEVLRFNGQDAVADSLEDRYARAGNWMATRSMLTAFLAYCHPQSLGGNQYPGIGSRAWEKRMASLGRSCREAVEALDQMTPEQRATFFVPGITLSQ